VTDTAEEALIGANAVVIESIIVALLTPFIGFATDWKYYIVFQLSLGIVILIMLLRVMAARASDPNLEIIRRSIGWSSRLLQLALIGALATISVRLSAIVEPVSPVIVFTGIAISLSLAFVLLDEIVLGEYSDTWTDIIQKETGDNPVGIVIQKIARFAKQRIDETINGESASFSESNLKSLLLGLILFLVLLIVSLPVSLILSQVFGDWITAVFAVISIILLRDLTRYVYINYGAAPSFSGLKWRLRWEFLWTVLVGILLAGSLGYEILTAL